MNKLSVNGDTYEIDVELTMPLLWVVREKLKLTGTKFGCGAGMCGVCTVLIDDVPRFSCLTPVSAALGKSITTIEGLSDDNSHPVQKAWLEEQVAQCGYCQSGQIMRATGLLKSNSNLSEEQIKNKMSPNLCRCATYSRIVKAVKRADKEMNNDQ